MYKLNFCNNIATLIFKIDSPIIKCLVCKTHTCKTRPYSSERLVINAGLRSMTEFIPVRFYPCQMCPE